MFHGMTRQTRLSTLVLAALLAGCSSSGGGSTTGPSSTELQVAGSYQVAPTITSNPCGTVDVQPGPATVAHAAGATEVRITHFSLTHTGQVQRSGSFATQPVTLALGNGSTDTVTMSGQFATGGFDATVNVDTNHAGAAPCRYVVRWQATKQGTPNVIP